MTIDYLPSWNDGTTKQAIVDFLDAARDVPVAEVVTGTRQQQRGIAAHLRYRLVCSPYAHDHPVRVAE